MSLALSCPACHKAMSVSPTLAGRRIKCNGCSTVLLVPGATKPASKSTSTPVPDADTPVPSKKKKKRKASRGRAPSKGLVYLTIGGGLALFLAVVTLAALYIPWGSFASRDIEAVDVYTAINGLAYHTAGERLLQSKTTALAIPGRRKIIVVRPTPEGAFLQLKLQVPYSDVDRYFPGGNAASRAFLTSGIFQLEAGGEVLQAMFVQEENDSSRGFQLDYSPRSENAKPLVGYLGPCPEFNWTHDGELLTGGDGMIFKGKRGMEVKIRVGNERQDGHAGGNLLNDLTGRKIFTDQDGLVSGPGGFIHVSWNENSGGYLVDDTLEQPNEIGRYWSVHCFFPRPKNDVKEGTLKVLDTTKKIKLP